MGYACQNTGAIPGVVIAAACPSMIHSDEHGSGVCQYLVGCDSFNTYNKSDATGIFLKRRILTDNIISL